MRRRAARANPEDLPMTEFAAHVDAFFEAYFAFDPISATGSGMHDHDGRCEQPGARAVPDNWQEDQYEHSTTDHCGLRVPTGK